MENKKREFATLAIITPLSSWNQNGALVTLSVTNKMENYA
jgi:hypothetical protein